MTLTKALEGFTHGWRRSDAAGLLGRVLVCGYLIYAVIVILFPDTVTLSLKSMGLSMVAARYYMGAGALAMVFFLFLGKRQWKFTYPADHRFLRAAEFLVFAGLFVLIVVFLKRFDVSWADYDRKGHCIIIYNSARFLLGAYLFIFCYAGGSLFFKKLLKRNARTEIGEGDYLVLSFFLGASLGGILMTVLGFLGLIILPVILLITGPFLFWVPRYLGELLGMAKRGIASFFGGLHPAESGLRFLLIWALFGTGALCLFSRGLYPGSLDNDVWEHYLPYYNQVLSRGGFKPSAIWYQIYESKGAGLFYLGAVLSDALMVQVVSGFFLVMTGIILLKVLSHLLRDVSWALPGLVIFFAIYDGDFFKNHVIGTAYVIFMVWSVTKILQRDFPHRKAYLWAMFVSMAYICFHLPSAASFLILFMLLIILGSAVFRIERAAVLCIGLIPVAIFVGYGLSLAVNYAVTGLADVRPIEILWSWADQEKAAGLLGTSGVVYLLSENSLLAGLKLFEFSQEKLQWLIAGFRLRAFDSIFPLFFVVLGLFLVLAGCISRPQREWVERLRRPTGVMLALLLPTLIFNQIIEFGSMIRFMAFTVFIITVFLMVLTKRVVESSFAGRPKPWIASALMLMICVLSVSQAIFGTGITRLKPMIAYAMGKSSVADALRETDGQFGWNLKLSTWEKIRRGLGAHERVFNLGYDPGPGYAFPGAGAASEPTYSLGPHHEEIIFGPPDAAKRRLKELGFNYFAVNLRSTFFTSLVFSELFKASALNQHFKIVFREGETFVLTWRAPQEKMSIPPLFIWYFDLKQTHVLYYPFSQKFRDDLFREFESSGGEIPSYVGILGEETVHRIVRILRKNMVDRVNENANKEVLERFIALIEKRLKDDVIKLILDQGQGSEPKTFENVVSRVIWRMNQLYIVEYGKEIAVALTHDYKPLPFASIYRSRENYRSILRNE